MLIRWAVAALHLIALGIGLGAVWARARALSGAPDPAALRRAFYADNLWLAAAVLWIATGLARVFAGLEKGWAYYAGSDAFWVKMGLLGLVLVLEVWPMVALIRWRIQLARGASPDTRRAGALAAISYLQAILVVAMVLAATAMARGIAH